MAELYCNFTNYSPKSCWNGFGFPVHLASHRHPFREETSVLAVYPGSLILNCCVCCFLNCCVCALILLFAPPSAGRVCLPCVES